MKLLNFLLLLIILVYGNTKHSSPATFKIFEGCKDDICLKEDAHTDKKIYPKLNSKFNKISGNFSNNAETKENLIQMPHFKSSDQIFMAVTSKIKSNQKNLSNEGIEFFTKFYLSDSIKNTTEVTSEYISEARDILNSTDQYISATTPENIVSPYIMNSTYGSASHFNLTNDTYICFCDMLINECDINCCCDRDCNSNHLKVFTKCIEKDYDFESNYCYKNSFIFKNNSRNEIFQTKQGLFCIVRDNLRSVLQYKTKQIINDLESFKKVLPKHFYLFENKQFVHPGFEAENYHAGSLIWTVQSGGMKPFEISKQTIGLTCTSTVPIRYLVNQVAACSQPALTEKNKCVYREKNFFYLLQSLKIISSPHLINKTVKFDYNKICEGKACIGISIVLCQDKGNCSEISVKQSTSPNFWCRNVISKLQYKIWHNGSEGIKKFEAFIWLKYISHEFNGRFLQTTEVKFLWIDSSEKTYRKSGNPGYIIGKPILTSRKISTENGTSGKREVMELSDMDNYLSVLGSEKGICSFQKRVPITFQENSHYSCSLLLSKDNFGKESCIELQKTIFMLLLGEDVVHAKNDNYFNKFIATFGNAKVENTGDWIQILIDFFPVTATQVGFKFGYNTLMCKNIISELFVEIAYSNVGSFFYPQAKILGTSFQFGKHRDLLFYCGTLGCENASHYQYFKLSSMVHFIDLTEPANNAYAEPLGLKVKLPHDFFYPFFSIGSMSQSLNKFILIFLFLTIKKTVW